MIAQTADDAMTRQHQKGGPEGAALVSARPKGANDLVLTKRQQRLDARRSPAEM